MKAKTNIKKPFYNTSSKAYVLCATYLSMSVFVGLPFFFTGAGEAETQNSQTVVPKVLAAETGEVRGQPAPLEPKAKPVLLSQPDFSNITARSFLVYDLESGEVLGQRMPTQQFAIASLTKLLTGYIVYTTASMDDYVTIEPQDVLSVSPSLHLQVGDKVKVYDLFNAMLIGSCNDAARALGNYIERQSGVKFVDLMNATAKSLGMQNSSFDNPMGFDSDKNYSTAEDLRTLVQATENYSAFLLIGRQEKYVFTNEEGKYFSTKASNKLISQDYEIASVKTGFTQAAGESMITRATHGGKTIVIVVLKSTQREADTEALKNIIFSNYSWE